MKRIERLETRDFEDNALLNWMKVFSTGKTVKNILSVSLARYLPLRPKNIVLRSAGVELGENVGIGFEATFDIFRPDLISVGDNTTIGYDATILTHETTREEFRVGPVEIGDNVLIGARTTILPGVKIGDNARVSAHSLVNRDVEEGEFVGGVPVEQIQSDREKTE
ncbi:MAG: DapH/DapD/GlmU-related protein [Candidatus Nanohaloarchaea archaeon]